jgi:predicted N-formylglutamate amidohydrolase
MPEGPDNNTNLLNPGEPTPYRVINPLAESPTLLVCDHASSLFPEALGDMGLDPFARRCHLALDIGAGALTERWPYHKAISDQVLRLRSAGPPPLFVSIHSFTPVLNGVSRSVEMGVLWDADEEVATIVIEELRSAGYTVGDNEPYSGKAPQDFTVDHHAEGNSLRHAAIEIRQDLIDDDHGVDEVAAVLHRVFDLIPERIGLRRQARSA